MSLTFALPASYSEAVQPNANLENELQLRIGELEREVARYQGWSAHLKVRDAALRVLVEATSAPEIPQRLLEAIGEQLEWSMGAYWVHNTSKGILECVSTWCKGGFEGFDAATRAQTLAVGCGLPGKAWQAARPIWINDVLTGEDFPRLRSAIRAGVHGWAAFPVVNGGNVKAVLEFFSSESRPPDENLLQAFSVIGQAAGLVLERLRAAAELSSEVRVYALRADIAFALGQSVESQSILRECTDAIVERLDAAFARIWTLNTAQNMLELQVSSGLYTHIDGPHSRIPVGAFKIGWIARTRQPHFTNSVTEDPRVTDHEWAKREHMQSFAGFPLLAQDRLAGVLALFSRHVLEPSVLEQLGPLADALGQFIERRGGEQKLARSEALKAAMLDTSPDAIVAMDSTGRVVEFSREAERMFGYSRSAVLGRQMADLIIPPRLREAHRVGLARYSATGEGRVVGQRFATTAMRADGSELPVELVIRPIPNSNPAIFGGYIRPLGLEQPLI